MPRYASIWFPYLLTEYAARKSPQLRETVFVLASTQRGRMVIDAVSPMAAGKEIHPGMVLADCKAIFPELEVIKSEPGQAQKLLNALAEWCIGYTPLAAIDLPDGIVLDISGCAHLWGGESQYLGSIKSRLNAYGYTVKIAIADTIGSAWATARFSNQEIVKARMQREALQNLPPAALRLEPEILARLKKLGLQRIESFMNMPRTALRRRFGPSLSLRLGQALGQEIEMIISVKPVEPYQERLCSMEPICTAVGITIALKQLLDSLCIRFEAEGLGLRNGIFRAYRVDGDIQQIEIGTSRPSRNEAHLFKLFEHKITTLEPALGFEMFVLEAPKVEPITDEQSAIWTASSQNDKKVAELLDRVAVKTGTNNIMRYLPAEHYWPERSIKQAVPLWEKPVTAWRTDWPRPIHLLEKPEVVEVTAVLPDYPPMLFRYKGKIYNIARSDGPERIEQEWWLTYGLYRDYYCVEDESGARYWLFRSGPYDAGQPKWFIHGFFA
jgi:protein ImuB